MRRIKGFGVLEIIIASALIAGSLYALASVLLLAGSAIQLSRERFQASLLLEEGMEVLRHLRDGGWDATIGALVPGQDYYLSFDGASGSWSTSSAPESAIEGVFLRSFRTERVSRDINANIESAYNPLNEDQEARKIVLRTDWTRKGAAYSLTLEGYVMDLFNN